MNNLTVRDKVFHGDFTFHKGESKLQSDILIANLEGIENAQSFTIRKVPWNPSDHTPLSTSLCVNISGKDAADLASYDILSTAVPGTRSKRLIIEVNSVNWETYKNITRNELGMLCDIMENLDADKNLDYMDNMIKKINCCMNNAVSASRNKYIVNHEAIAAETPEFEINQDLVIFIGHSVTKNNWKPGTLYFLPNVQKIYGIR